MHKYLNNVVLKIQACLGQESRKRNYYILYTTLFLILTFFCFSWFFLAGKSLIWGGDGWEQHYKALSYYAVYLRDILRNLIIGRKLVIPDWDFNIGEGSDIVSVLNYYAMGDPIALFSVFVPTSLMHYFYTGSCIFRLYLAGVAFSELCFGTGIRNRYGVLAGAYSYVFCMWALIGAALHIFFSNPMIYFPLMILGIEKVIHKKKPYLFIISAALSGACNFYFFYMIVIMAVAYALIRLGFLYRSDIRQGVLTLLRLGGYAVTGVCIGGAMILPVLMFFLHDNRLSSASQPFHLLYPMSYYSELPGVVVSKASPFWLCLGLTAPAVLAVYLLLRTKKSNTMLKTLVILGLLIMLFPIGGRILNGMSYSANRWCWGFILLCCYILAKEWEHLLSLSSREWRMLFVFSTVYFIVCLHFDKSRTASVFTSIIMLFISLAVMREKELDRKGAADRRSLLLIGIVMLGVVNNAFWEYGSNDIGFVFNYMSNSEVLSERRNNEAEVVRKLADSPYDRFSGRGLTQNANMLLGISSTQYFWTISNSFVSEYRSDLDMKEGINFYFDGYDDRTTPLALASVKYYTVNARESQSGLPYGYTLIDKFTAPNNADAVLDKLCKKAGGYELSDERRASLRKIYEKKYYVYENDYALPRGYCYDSYITTDEWKILNVAQRQQSLLSTAAVDEKSLRETPAVPAKYSVPATDYEVAYESECGSKNIVETDRGVVTTSTDQTLKLILDKEIKNAETYVSFEGLDFKPVPAYDRYLGDDSVDPDGIYDPVGWVTIDPVDKVYFMKEKFFRDSATDVDVSAQTDAGTAKSVYYLTEDASFSTGRHNFVINLGYLENPVTSVTITFPKAGIYTFDKLKIYSISMDDYPDKINKLKENSLENLVLDTDAIYGDIVIGSNSSDTTGASAVAEGTGGPKILCIAVPYETGWKGYIDGTEAEVLCVNEHYLGLLVPEGSHKIALRYSTPFRKAGILVTIFGFVLLALICTYERRHSEKQTHWSKPWTNGRE